MDKQLFLVYHLSMRKFFLFLLFLFLLTLISPGHSFAQVRPFGGRILYTDYCTCSGMNKIILYLPVSGNMPKVLSFRLPASRLFAYSNLEPGAEILGTTASPDACMMYHGNHCRPHPLVDVYGLPWLISLVGTSGLGGSSGSGSGTSGTGTGTTPPPVAPPPATEPVNQPCTNNSDKMASSYIIANEGWRNDPYRDPKEGMDIGVGHQITGKEPFPVNGRISDEQVGQLFASDYNTHKQAAASLAQSKGVNWNSLSPERQTVLIDMEFSMGPERFSGFTQMWKGAAAGDWVKAGEEISNSDYGKDSATMGRAARNAAVMRSGRPNMLNEKINSDPKARSYCAS